MSEGAREDYAQLVRRVRSRPGTSPVGGGPVRQPARTPDIPELRTFCVAAETGSLGRAAIRLHVSQPALSKRLASLERVAGTQLLARSSTGVTLTPAGRRLYEHARRLLEQADAIDMVLDGMDPAEVAASHSAAEAFVAVALSEPSPMPGRWWSCSPPTATWSARWSPTAPPTRRRGQPPRATPAAGRCTRRRRGGVCRAVRPPWSRLTASA